MKNTLHLLPLFTAIIVPGALGLEIAGIELPSSFSLGAAFSLSVAALVITFAFADYTRGNRTRVALAALQTETKAAHPLAA